ncbi:MAG: helix-turn-helix domain-containing protein [Planctomycetaceae bacterium]
MRLQFTDLDDYGDAVQHAKVELCMFRPVRHLWTMSQHPVGSLLLQLGQAGGGNICRGESQGANPIFFLPLSHPAQAAANGTRFNGANAMLLPSRAEFHLLHTTPHAWCSLSFPSDMLHDSLSEETADRAAWLETSAVRPFDREPLAHLAGLAEEYDQIQTVAPARLAHPAAQRQAEADFRQALRRLFETSPPRPRTPRGRPSLDRREIVNRLFAELENSVHESLTAPLLAERLGIAERTLRLVCRETLGLGPARYLKLRQLRLARQHLRDPRHPSQTVTELLSHLGIWQFGRFAGEYKATYGELPSQTFLRVRRSASA